MIHDEEKQDKYNSIRDDIGLCGCGRPEEVEKFIYDLLQLQIRYRNADISEIKKVDEEYKAFIKNTDPNIIREYILHTLEKAGIVEHGYQVYGSWLTDKGNEYLELIKEEQNDI